MIDIGSIGAAVASLKTAGEIAVALMDLKSATDIQGKVIELNQKIIAAQHQVFAANQAQTALVEEVRDLKSQIAQMKDWEAQKQRYKLAAPSDGGFVYALQKSMSDGEPPHYLCAACFKKGKPSILQGREGRPLGKDKGYARGCYVCPDPGCGAEAPTGYMNYPAPEYFEDIKPQR